MAACSLRWLWGGLQALAQAWAGVGREVALFFPPNTSLWGAGSPASTLLHISTAAGLCPGCMDLPVQAPVSSFSGVNAPPPRGSLRKRRGGGGGGGKMRWHHGGPRPAVLVLLSCLGLWQDLSPAFIPLSPSRLLLFGGRGSFL